MDKKVILHTGINSEIIKDGNRVKKVFKTKIESIEVNVACSKALFFSKHFPKVIEFTDNSIIMNYCGERLTKKNIPVDWENQMYEILSDLKAAKIKHNDCLPRNLLVNDDTIVLVDFGMAMIEGVDQNESEKEIILSTIRRRGNEEEDDEIMLRRALDFIRGKKIDKSSAFGGTIIPPHQFSKNTEWKELSGAITAYGRLYQKLPFHIKINNLVSRETEYRVEFIKNAYEFKGKVGVDFGCNAGAMTFSACKLGAECLGIDRDSRAIEIAWFVERYYETGAIFINDDITNAIRIMHEDASKGEACPFFNKQSSPILDFCFLFSVFPWMLHFNGLEKTIISIAYLSDFFQTMFFETSVMRDAGAQETWNSMEKAGLTTLTSVINFIEDNSNFWFVKSIGKSPDWHNRETLIFERNKI